MNSIVLTIKFKLQQVGVNRIDRLNQTIRESASEFLKRAMETKLRPKVLSYTPEPRLEAELLSEGYADVGKIMGVPDGRFFKGGVYGFKYLYEAIQEEQVHVQKSTGDMVWGKFGKIKTLNDKIGFFWFYKLGEKDDQGRMTKARSTRDGGEAWKTLIQQWEFGGTPFTVRRRPEDIARGAIFLAPGPGKKDRTETMWKEIPRFGMFQKGFAQARPEMVRYITWKLKEKIRKAK